MEKQRLREVKGIVQGHMSTQGHTGKGQSGDEPGSTRFEPELVTLSFLFSHESVDK